MSPFGQRSLDDKLKWTAGCIECQQETTGQSSSLRQLLPSSRPSFTLGSSRSFSTLDWCRILRSHSFLRASGSSAPGFPALPLLKNDTAHADDVGCCIAFGLEMIKQQAKGVIYPAHGTHSFLKLIL